MENHSLEVPTTPRHSMLLKSYFQSPRCLCLVFSLLIQLFLILSFSDNLRHFILNHPKTQQCSYGRFYVYDLPKQYNAEVLENCGIMKSSLGSRCKALSNNGFGPKATGIDLIIPSNLSNVWYWTDQFALEIIFHNRLLHHKCRTLEAESAAAYYIPFYVGLDAERYLWSDVSSQEKDRACLKLLSWVQSNFPYMNKSNGLNHFLVMGRVSSDFRRRKDEGSSWDKWGSKCNLVPSMKNITRLLIERDTLDDFEVGVPYPTGFHPNTPLDIASWQRFVLSRPRHLLFSFAGGPRSWIESDFRGKISSQCNSLGEDVCNIVDCSHNRCSNGTNDVLETFLDSNFCLQPRGDTYTRRSIFDCLIAGSIPVFFWQKSAYLQYEWFLPDEPKSYSVFIHYDEVLNGTSIKSVLEKISEQEVNEMREKVVEFIPRIIYSKPNAGLGIMKDAVDIALDGVLRRINKQADQTTVKHSELAS